MTPQCSRVPQTRYEVRGPVSGYLRGVTEQWLKVAPQANPAMLEMLRDRERQPLRNLLPWSGEFAGKYLTSAVQVLRLTGDEGLREQLRAFVQELVSLQAEDGYLGPWPVGSRLSGTAPNVGGKEGGTWDAWGHYHAMLGLLLWHQDTGDDSALECASRMGDLICRLFLGSRHGRLVDTGSTEMNLAPAHSLALLYGRRPEPRYLEMALQIVDEFAAQGADGPLAGDYLRHALAGKEFHQGPKPRWESLHPIMALAELYWLTGREDFRRAFEQIWWSIVRLDRHNNGGFSSGEQAQGNPYHQGAIETCCTIAWMAMTVEMLRLTGNPVVADELEVSTLNSGLGLMSPTGRWVTYNTPMDGVRRASAHEIVFQAREGSPELNCCSVNGPRGLGMISDWALMGDAEGLLLNWYGPCRLTAPLAGGLEVELEQQTSYPKEGRVAVQVRPSRPAEFALRLRVPHWSEGTRVRLNGEGLPRPLPGQYLGLRRRWQAGDRVELELDLRARCWVGERESQGLTSVYRGPLLLAYDRRLNAMDPDRLPALEAAELAAAERISAPAASAPPWLPTLVVVSVRAVDGQVVRLCDFASAGQAGTPYRSWLPIEGARPTAFSTANPLRSGRV
ncbi:MAG: beta-L-arabinofuranosidase domain-containing protein [Candidatus Latescibacterota bacterium]